MTNSSFPPEKMRAKMQWAYAATRLLDTPFWGIFNMLPFILYKDLQATPYQLAVLVTLKPLVAIFSSYWTLWINKSGNGVIKKIIFLRATALAPFIFPIFDSSWLFIAAFALYTMIAYGIMPTWMELLKTHVPQLQREKLFTYTQAFGYLGGGLLPFALGTLLDDYDQAWRWLFPLAALLSLSAAYFQWQIIMIPLKSEQHKPPQKLSHQLLFPWKNAFALIKTYPDFRNYQMGFMIIGCGLMVIQPALPIYFVDTLHLTYTELAVALTLCKGLGFALASPLWASLMTSMNFFRLSSLIAGLASLFPLTLLYSQQHISWLYLSYLTYGFMQCGNELCWNMSGPHFSKENNSTPYTSINTMAIGIRGAIMPAFGSVLITFFGAEKALAFGGLFCLIAMIWLYISSKEKVYIKAPL